MTGSLVALLRASAAVAALVLAVASQGDALVVAALLAVAAWRPFPALAIGAGLVAASWRWGSTSLEAIAGAQAVLGPAGLVGSSTAAASAWLAGLAVLLAAVPLRLVAREPAVVTSRRGRLVAAPADPAVRAGGADRAGPVLAALAAGAAAAVVVAGPAAGRDGWIRVVATMAAIVVALFVGRLRARWAAAIDVAALVAGAAALGLAAGDAPAWPGTVDITALGTGAAIAAAVALGAAVALRAAAMRPRRA